MWLRLNTKKNIVIDGDKMTFFPGDWLEAEFNLGRQWIMAGLASVPCLSEAMPLDRDCGVVIVGDTKIVFNGHPSLPIKQAKKPTLPKTKTLILSKGAMIRPEILSFCFDLLDRWDVIAPFNDGYSDGCVFVKKSEAAMTFVKQWAKIGFSDALAESKLNTFGLPIMEI